jgi:uncharacterized membrane protein YebE (DUF533 family)
MEVALKQGEHKLFYKLVLYAGVAMVIYGSYNWYNNRKNDNTMNNTTPPNNPSDLTPTTQETNEILTSIPTRGGGITRGNSIGNFWSK